MKRRLNKSSLRFRFQNSEHGRSQAALKFIVMPNEVRTRFIIEEGDAPRKVQNYEKNLNNLADAGGNSLNRITAFANSTTNLSAPTFAADLSKDFNKLTSQTNSLQKDFSSLAKERLNSGEVGSLTKEIVRASERSRQLQADITNIQKELSSPNRKSSVGFLTEELKAAQRETESLNRKLNSLPGNVPPGGDTSTKRFGSSNRLSTFQKQNLSYQINDVLTGLASGQNPTQILAQQGGQIAQIFDPAQIAAFASKYAGLVTILGAGAAALALTYKITGDIRAEAERRLKAEELITGAINKQIIGNRESLKNLREMREEAERSRVFAGQLQNDSPDQLKSNRATAERLLNLNPQGENAERYKKTIVEIDAQLAARRQNSIGSANDSFNQRNESFKKSQQDAIESEKRLEADRQSLAKKRAEDAKKLVGDFRDTFISLKSVDNPLVKMMTDFETAAERAKEKFGALGDSVVDKIAAIERANLTKAVGLQTFENNFKALKFDQEARVLAAAPERSFAPFQRNLELVERKVDFVAKISDLDKKITESDYYTNRFNPNNPKSFEESRMSFAERARGGAGGLQLKDAIQDILALQNISLEGTGIYGKNVVADKVLSAIPSRDDLLKALKSPFADVRGNADFLLRAQGSALSDRRQFETQKFNDFLEDQKTTEFGKRFAREQISLIDQNRSLTDAQKAQRRLDVTDSLGNDLDAGLKRQRITDFVESRNEARNQAEQAMKIAAETRDALKDVLNQLRDKGVKIDGSGSAIELLLKNESNAGAELKPAATARDTQKAYDDAYAGGTFYEQSRR